MSEAPISDSTSAESEKPVQVKAVVKFPPFPTPSDNDFEEDIPEGERIYYKNKFKDLNMVTTMRLHCSACDRHLGCAAKNESRMRAHPMLRTLVCHTCHTFYNSGEFEKGDDGSELYCRWCGQGGQVYCCSNCPHVFCAKCIKRNLGVAKIKEIENTDDWKCFKCNSKCLWEIRAICWALMRYCDLKNKITYRTQDPVLKEAYQKDCATDFSECCKHKSKRKVEPSKKKDIESIKKSTAAVISKIPPTIQVKKFASIISDNSLSKQDKKPVLKRPASPPKPRGVLIKSPVPIAPRPRILTPNVPSGPKKMRPSIQVSQPIRILGERPNVNTYSRIRAKCLPHSIQGQFNGMGNSNFTNFFNDNINLSLDSLTQGIDMNAVAAMSSNMGQMDDDVVCTPDFPLEPVCEVTEDNVDDDVQCITPGPVAAPKPNPSGLLVNRSSKLPELTSDNIIQMTDNDVTVNAATGGLKFRVDPQTLSSNKMYRLPDGRIFAINANPNMPGGYSATIVAVTETQVGKPLPKGATFAAKLSAVSTLSSSTPNSRNQSLRNTNNSKRRKSSRINKTSESPPRSCDLDVPVEWFRYNLIDAVDALEYSLGKLNKLKKEATTMHLRTRTVDEMRNLHRALERLLNTSSNRFSEIRDNLNKELKQYIIKKSGEHLSEEDDDVEILPDAHDNDDPIFIDENSVESNLNETICSDSHEVDLTGAGSSDHNNSGENREDNLSNIDKDPLDIPENICPSNIENGESLVTPNENDNVNHDPSEDMINKDTQVSDKETETTKTDDTNVKPEINNEEDDSAKANGNTDVDMLKCDESETESTEVNGAVVETKKEKDSEKDIKETPMKDVADDKNVENIDNSDDLIQEDDLFDRKDDVINSLCPDIRDKNSVDKINDGMMCEDMIDKLLNSDDDSTQNVKNV